MKRIRRTLGTIVGLVLSFTMLSTQVYATESFENSDVFIEDEQTFIDENASGDLMEKVGNFTEGSLLIIDNEQDIEVDESGELSEEELFLSDEEENSEEDLIIAEPEDEEEQLFSASFVEVNPIYEDIITEEELAEIIEANEEDNDQQLLFYSLPSQTFTSLDEVAAYLKDEEKARNTDEITFKVDFPDTFENYQEINAYLDQAVSIAEKHTGNGSEGDYLRFNRLGQSIQYSYREVDGGRRELTEVTYSFSHLTTAAQEAEVTACLNNEVYPSLALDNKSQLGRIKAIYSYITANVDYDNEHLNDKTYLIKHATYAALINHTAVCQGYATLLYRMLLDVGIDSRVITSADHAWNIARVEGRYYNMDSTWDSNYDDQAELWQYYLRGSDNFIDHPRKAEYTTPEFLGTYPTPADDYDWQNEDVDPDYPLVTTSEWDAPGRILFTAPKGGLSYVVQIQAPLLFPDGEYYSATSSYDNQEIAIDCPDVFLASGNYKFRIKTTSSTGDRDFYTGSISVWKSGTYEKPQNIYDTPTNPRWTADGSAEWDAVDGSPNYIAFLYRDGELSQYAETKSTRIGNWAQQFYPKTGNYTFKVFAYGDDPAQIGASEPSEESSVYGTEPEPYDFSGIAEGDGGNLYLYENGTIKSSFSGLYEDVTYGWAFIREGKVDFDFDDVYEDATYGWWKIKNGTVDFGFSDFFESPKYGWWKIEGGQVDFGYNDLYESRSYGWWYVRNGQVAFDCTDLVEDSRYGWWKVKNGAVDFDFSDFYESPKYGWWKIDGGRVDFDYNDLYESHAYGWWYVRNGQVAFDCTDLVEDSRYGWWLVSGGMVDFGYSDVFYSQTYGYWKVNGGMVDFGFNGRYNSSRYGQCYVEGGRARLLNAS